MQQLNILVFAYFFPPDAASGTYRTLYFANHWAKQGDQVTIVTVKEECFLASTHIDRRLCKEVHPSIRVVRASAKRPLKKLLDIKRAFSRKASVVQAVDDPVKIPQVRNSALIIDIYRRFKDTITDMLSCPDEHIGWVPDAVRRACRITNTIRVDCIYATGGPWSSLLAGLRLHKRCGTPLVLDFRDPWISNPNLTVRTPFSRWVQKKMETMCVNAASMVIANTEELRQDFIKRYPNIEPTRFVTITNGFEDMPQKSNSSTERFTLVHAGALYRSRNPLNFLRAVIELVSDGTIPANTFRVQLVGGVSVADGIVNYPEVESMLSTEAIRDVLEIIPPVSHDDALMLQQRANALVLFQQGFSLQVPRKLYEYFSLARPILAITECHSASARLMNELRAGYVVDDNVNAIKRAIVALYMAWKSGQTMSIDEEKLRAYQNRHLADKLRDNILKLLSDK